MSSTIISIIVCAVVAIILLISFFMGRKRGVKRTLLNSGFSLAGLILAFFLTPVITNAIAGISFNLNGKNTTLGNALTTILMDESQFKVYLENSSSLQGFVQGIVIAVCSVVVFSILCSIFKFLFYIVYKIIDKFALPSKEEELENGYVRNKLGGGILSVVKTFLFLIVVMMPITSLAQFAEKNFFDDYASASASSITDTLDSLPTTRQISNEIPSEVKKIVAGYNKSIFGWCGNIFGIGDVAFDYLSQIEINGSKVSVRSSTDDMLGFYNYFVDQYEEYKEEPTDFFKNVDYTEFNKYKDQLLNSGVFKGLILNVVNDYIQNYEVVFKDTALTQDYNLVMKDVKEYLADEEKPNEILIKDFNKIFDMLVSAGKNGLLDEINKQENLDAKELLFVMCEDYTDTVVSDVIDAAFNINTFRASFSSLADVLKTKLGSSEVEDVLKTANVNVTNWEQFIIQMKDIVTDLGDLYNHLATANIDFEELTNDYYQIFKAQPSAISPVLTDIGGILDKVNNLEIMKNADSEKILNSVLDAVGFGDVLEGVVAPSGMAVNYTYAMQKITPAIKTLLEFDLYDEIKEKDFNGIICQISKKMYDDSKLTHPEGVKTVQEKVEEVFSIIYEMPKMKELTIDEIKPEIGDIVNLDVLDNASERASELRHMTNLLMELENNTITVGGETKTFLTYLLEDGTDFEGLITSIPAANISNLLTPILKSNLTNSICTTIFDTIADVFGDAINSELTITYTKAQLNNQCEEICAVFEKFITLYNERDALGGTISSVEDLDYTKFGELLDAIKANAYRREIPPIKPGEDGIFKPMFDSVIDSIENTFGEGSQKLDFKKLTNKNHIYEVEFKKVLGFVETLESGEATFVSAIKDLVSDGAVDANKVTALFDSITITNADSVIAILNAGVGIDVDIDTSSVGSITISSMTYTVSDAINNNDAYSNWGSTDMTKLNAIKTSLLNILG